MDMGRCTLCYGVVTRNDDECYGCGAHLQRYAKSTAIRRPVSAWTNAVFFASLAFTAYCWFAEHKLSLPVTLAISSTLLLIRIVAERLAKKNSN